MSRLFYNSDNEYFHGFCDKYPNCPGNGGKLKRFVGGKSGTELARISDEKYVEAKRLLLLSLVDKEFTFERIYTCHFFKGLKDPSSGFTTDTWEQFVRINGIGHRSLRLLRYYSEFERASLKTEDLLNLRTNYFVMAKLKMKPSLTFGYNIQRFCSACHLEKEGEEEKETSHKKRLSAVCSAQSYELYHSDYFKFLVTYLKAEVVDVTHAFLFSNGSDFKDGVEKILKLRTLCDERGFSTIANTLKTGVNSFVGFLGRKSNARKERRRFMTRFLRAK